MVFDVGRICVKLAGRDAGKQCVVIDVLDNHHVMIDGATRRRKCNNVHLEPTEKTLDIGKNASHEDVLKAFGITEKKKGQKKTIVPRPRKIRKAKPKPVKAVKAPLEKKIEEAKPETPKAVAPKTETVESKPAAPVKK